MVAKSNRKQNENAEREDKSSEKHQRRYINRIKNSLTLFMLFRYTMMKHGKNKPETNVQRPSDRLCVSA